MAGEIRTPAVLLRWAGACRALFISGFLATALGGCTYLDDLGLTFGDLLAFPEPPESTVLVAPAPPPKYQFGDTFVFDDDGSMVEERVIAIDGPLIVWENNSGKQWTAKADPILPPVLSDGVSRTFSLNADKIFPLSKGLKFRYVVNERGPGNAKVRQTRSCEVTAMPLITVRAGSFDTYEIFCRRGDYTETLYYAPKANNVILAISKTPGGEKVRELISYVKGTAARATGPRPVPRAMLPGISQGQAKPAVPGANIPALNSPPPSAPLRTKVAGPDDPFAGISPSLTSLIRRMDERIRALEMSERSEKAGERETKISRRNKKTGKTVANARKSAVSGYAVQLGAYGTMARARRAWGTSFALAAAAVLSPLGVRFESYQSAKGARLVRILVGNYKSRRRAGKLCRRLKKRGLDCLVVKTP